MLELRPCCEHCAVALHPASLDARICSFECTFCASCAEGLLGNVCPNCGGGFVPRPVRPSHDWKGGNHLGGYPARTVPKLRPVDLDAHARLVQALNGLPPEQR
ncbi:hypothetical protein J2X16_003835 [Pelomonas aquatica]|uniref:Urease n=1 Tax=Pelomonas aquatica TaxID=431058 RepID=A0ABU1ZCY2_9BURK|nr:DUF1272 domain-containing protein [Pelomonas aquatica]MDR7298472.1 hypothetical protein [Pelomonas aquatica]